MVWERMQSKCSEPVLKYEPYTDGWIGSVDAHEGDCAPSKPELPEQVPEHDKPVFTPPRVDRRGGGKPSVILLRFLQEQARNSCTTSSRGATTVDHLSTRALILQLWLWFFGGIMKHICLCTNAKATEPVIKVLKECSKASGRGSKHYTVKRVPPSHVSPWDNCLSGCVAPARGLHHVKCQHFNRRAAREMPAPKTRPRCEAWSHPMCVGELIVWCGIQTKMGAHPRKRVAHYWSKRTDFACQTIKRVMKRRRFEEVTSNLSFAPIGTKSGYAKYEHVDSHLKKQARLACCRTQKMTGDECMIESHSKVSPKVYMPRKPIKWGIKVCYNDTPTTPNTLNTQHTARANQ